MTNRTLTDREKLHTVSLLTNCIQGEVTSKQKDTIAHLIFGIIEEKTFTIEMQNAVLMWKLESNKSVFVKESV